MNSVSNNTSRQSVDRIARSAEFSALVQEWGFTATTDAIRVVQQAVRKSSSTAPKLAVADYVSRVSEWLDEHRDRGHVPVFNLTGTIIHTNLGRAVVDSDLLQRAIARLHSPIALEYDLQQGKRGQREKIIEDRLCRLTNSDAAVVVNNNAAALLLLLNTLALNKDVLVSRGELIEIGGSFRLPELMSRAGCRLVEVGTTNRTRIDDYKRAITPNTALILKVHKSNYSIQGFVQEASEQELASLSKATGIPFAVDLGSGALLNTERFGLPQEQQPQHSLNWGGDCVTFSGDKLLGGPQSGLIVGNSEICHAMNSNPLKRALRVDKVTLAILDETLKAYEDPQTVTTYVKLYRDLEVSERILKHRGSQVHQLLSTLLPDFSITLEETESQVGSGAQPDSILPSVAVVVAHSQEKKLQALEKSLRKLDRPVVGRRHKARLHLDMRGADPLDALLDSLHKLSC